MNHLPQNPQKSIKKAIFLDRDGTLNVDYGYVYQPEKIQLIDGVKAAIQELVNQQFLLFLFTNQPGITRGIYQRSDVDACHDRLFELLGGNFFTEICVADEDQYDLNNYRKPSPKFILEMIEKYTLDPEFCYMIGDKETDAFAGVAAGIQSILLDSDYPRSRPCKAWVAFGKIQTATDLPTFVGTLSFSQ